MSTLTLKCIDMQTCCFNKGFYKKIFEIYKFLFLSTYFRLNIYRNFVEEITFSACGVYAHKYNLYMRTNVWSCVKEACCIDFLNGISKVIYFYKNNNDFIKITIKSYLK